MDLQTLDYHISGEFSLGVRYMDLLLKNFHGFSQEDIFSPIISLWDCCNVLALDYIIYKDKELQKWPRRPGIQEWDINWDNLAINFTRLYLYLDPQGVEILVRLLSNQRFGLEIYHWRRAMVPDVLKDMEIHCIELSRSLIKFN